MAAEFFLAVDIGGTSSRAAVVDPAGACVGYATGGNGNPTAAGPDRAAAEILDAVTAALSASGVAVDQLAAAVAAIAGGQGPPGRALQKRLLAAGLPGGLRVESDLLAMYLSGTLAAAGYAVISGTGAIAARVREGRVERVCDGLGWLLGDAGSGYWIGHRGARAALAALDGLGQATALTPAVLAALGIAPSTDRGDGGRLVALEQAVEALYQLRPTELARFAPAVFELAAAGDAVAEGIVAEASAALAATVTAAASPDVNGPIVLGGGVLAEQPSMVEAVTGALAARGIDGPTITVSGGVVGAAVLALRGGGVDVDADIHERLQTTVAARR